MAIEKPRRQTYNSHLTIKPIAIFKRLIKLFSIRGQIVLDPFIGSGTAAIAALSMGRSCVGIEINQDYIDIANQRIKERAEMSIRPKQLARWGNFT